MYNKSRKVNADLAHPVERHLAKVKVASSSLVIRSTKRKAVWLYAFIFVYIRHFTFICIFDKINSIHREKG